MPISRRKLLIAAVASCAGALDASALSTRAWSAKVLEGPAFGASWRVRLAADTGSESMRSSLQAVIDKIDVSLSPFRADAEIARFNASSGQSGFALSAPACTVVTQSLEIARRSAGAFDPTVGGIVGRYGFGPISQLANGDYRDIELRDGKAYKAEPALSLDLCGIAKGYALDRMVALLDSLNQGDFLVELGGELYGRGRNPTGRPWQVAVENPVAGEFAVQRLLRLNDEAIATSGDRINSYRFGDRRYGHIIDPRQGIPADQGLASVSVLAPSAMLADAWATALYAAGPAAGPALAESERLSALFVLRADQSSGTDTREIFTGRFDERVMV